MFNHVMVIVNDLDATVWIALGSMLAAFIAASEAVRNRLISSRMYDIAVREQLRTETPLDVYLADARILHVPGEQRRVYAFELLITNKSAARQLYQAVVARPHVRPTERSCIESRDPT